MLDGIVARLELLPRLPHHGAVERSVGLIYNVTMKLNGCQYEPNLGIRIQYEVKISPETKVLLIRFFQKNNTVHVYNQYIFPCVCIYIYICIYVCVYNFETSSFRILLQDKLCSSKASTGLCTGLLLDSSLPIKFLRWDYVSIVEAVIHIISKYNHC